MYATRESFPPSPSPRRPRRRPRKVAPQKVAPQHVAPQHSATRTSPISSAVGAARQPLGHRPVARAATRPVRRGTSRFAVHPPTAHPGATASVGAASIGRSAPPLSKTTRRAIHRQAARRQRISALTRETAIKLSINTFLITLSAAALAKLVPTHLNQQAQLREIRSELTSAQERVNELRADFSRTFDPMQAYSVMQQQSHLIDPNQRPVVFTQRSATTEQIQP